MYWFWGLGVGGRRRVYGNVRALHTSADGVAPIPMRAPPEAGSSDAETLSWRGGFVQDSRAGVGAGDVGATMALRRPVANDLS